MPESDCGSLDINMDLVPVIGNVMRNLNRRPSSFPCQCTDWRLLCSMYIHISLSDQIIAFSLLVRYHFMWNLVTLAVENCDVIVRLERVGCDYQYSAIEVVQVVG